MVFGSKTRIILISGRICKLQNLSGFVAGYSVKEAVLAPPNVIQDRSRLSEGGLKADDWMINYRCHSYPYHIDLQTLFNVL